MSADDTTPDDTTPASGHGAQDELLAARLARLARFADQANTTSGRTTGTDADPSGRHPAGAGLPTWEEMRRRAFALLGDAEDELRSDWRSGTGPTMEQGRARIDALEAIAQAKAALDRGGR